MDFQPICQSSQVQNIEELTKTIIFALQAHLQEIPKNRQDQKILISDLIELISVWLKLPEHIKQAIHALIKTI